MLGPNLPDKLRSYYDTKVYPKLFWLSDNAFEIMTLVAILLLMTSIVVPYVR